MDLTVAVRETLRLKTRCVIGIVETHLLIFIKPSKRPASKHRKSYQVCLLRLLLIAYGLAGTRLALEIEQLHSIATVSLNGEADYQNTDLLLDIINAINPVDDISKIPLAQLCSYCYLAKLQLMQQSPFSIYDNVTFETRFKYAAAGEISR
jgi:hypothetical protein